ncbi:MAG TPA: hypothetical protein PLD84_00975 [Chitinophagales bacterium]|nr:hypothetical protein [Chitinophagales bacterium]
MKRYAAILVLGGLLAFEALTASAQPNPFLKFSSVNAGVQLWSPSETASLEKLKLLAKDETDFTPIDLADYHQGFITINSADKNGVPFILPNDKVNTSKVLKRMRFYGQLGFIPYSKKKERYLENRELLFGMYYQPYVYHNTNFMNRDTVLVDSIIGNYVYYTEWSPVLGFTGDYLFKTDPSKRAGAYFGAGVGIGTAIHPVILENYGSFVQTIQSDTFANGISTVQYFEGMTDTKNNIPAAASLLLELRFPFGGTLRIAEGFFILANIEGKLSKQVYFNGESFASRFGIAGTLGAKYQF